MPYALRKIRNKNCYKVFNARTGRIHAKCSTKENAEAQVRLLNRIAKESGADKYV